MKKLILLLLLVCTGTTLSWAQGSKRVTVSGTVVDGDDKSPIAQATVQLLSLPDSMGHRTKRILRIERKEYQTY